MSNECHTLNGWAFREPTNEWESWKCAEIIKFWIPHIQTVSVGTGNGVPTSITVDTGADEKGHPCEWGHSDLGVIIALGWREVGNKFSEIVPLGFFERGKKSKSLHNFWFIFLLKYNCQYQWYNVVWCSNSGSLETHESPDLEGTEWIGTTGGPRMGSSVKPGKGCRCAIGHTLQNPSWVCLPQQAMLGNSVEGGNVLTRY